MTYDPEQYGSGTPVRAAIVQLLSQMRDGKEIREYLSRFSKLDQERFAVIKVGGAILRDELESLAEALAFLQTVGLTPIVVHGGGPQLDTALEAAGIETEREDGLRVTRSQAIPVIRETLTQLNVELVEAIRARGGRAASIPYGVFEADIIDESRLGRVGEPSGVRLDQVAAAARAGQAPILSCLADTPDGVLVNVNGDAAVRALVHALQPYKIIFLTGTGALLNEAGEAISAINLATDFDTLMKADWVNGGMQLKLQEIQRLLADLPLSSSVSITHPVQLTKELFTHAGAGTLVRRGERILELNDRSDLKRDQFSDLIKESFGRPLVSNYLETLDFHHAFITESYRAAAVLSQIDEMIYLDKFAVLEDARGEGLGGAVWRHLTQFAPEFFWRSRYDNPINEFYFNACDGAVRSGVWTVFWRGPAELDKLPERVRRIAELPPTLEDSSS